MGASKKAKMIGCKSLRQVSQESKASEQTLCNWFKNKPELFEVVCIGVKVKLETEKIND